MTATPARKTLRWWLLGGGVGAAFLWLALGQASVADTWRTLQQANAAWALAAWAAGVVFMALKALRWQLLLQPLQHFALGVVQAAVYAGTAANLLVPHSGEVLRASLLGRKAHRPASPILATVVLERILDFAALVLLAALGVALQPQGSQWLVAGGLTGLALVALGVGAVALALRPSARVLRLARRLIGLLPAHTASWLALQVRRARAGLQPIGQPSRWLVLCGLSVLQWACIVAAVAACAQSVGAAVPLAGAILVFVIMVAGLTLPSPPVQLGATQLAFVFGFEWHGASGAQGLAASAVYTLVVLGWMLIGGAAIGAMSDWRRHQPAPSHAADPQA